MRRVLIYKLLLAALACTGLYFFCNQQTKGFRPYLILSNLPNDPRWEAPPLSCEEMRDIDARLDQTFTFLGKGGWCFAFLGEDGKTVLKFYRHDHLRPLDILKNFSWSKLFLQAPTLASGVPYFQEFSFKSCMLLHTMMKERAGLLYIHLNKTQGKHKPVTLIDPIGVRHTIDLDRTEFVVQKKGELFVDFIRECVKKGDLEAAKSAIDSYFSCMVNLCQMGIRDLDCGLRTNYGIIDGNVTLLDISSFVYDPILHLPAQTKTEIAIKSYPLTRRLQKKHPELYAHCAKKLSEVLE